MEEEEMKAKSVLDLSEIGFVMNLVQDSDDRNLLGEQRKLFIEKRLQEIWSQWQLRRWETVIQGILKIPGNTKLDLLTMPDFYGKARVESLGRLSVIMLFKNAFAHLSVEQVKLVNEVLPRIDQDGKGLNGEPWKEMFLKIAKKFFPDNIKEMIEAVKGAGIDEKEYVKLIWEHVIEIIEKDKDLVEQLVANSDFVKIVMYVDEYMHGSQVHARELLQAGDALLARKSFRAARNVYKMLAEKQNLIGEAREKIIEIQDRDNDKLSYERMVRKIKQVIKKFGLDIKIK